MTKIKLEIIIVWILILLSIAIAVWLLIGSPPASNGLLAIISFIAASVIAISKTFFSLDNKISQVANSLDKKTEVSFVKIKYELKQINTRLNSIENLIKRKK